MKHQRSEIRGQKSEVRGRRPARAFSLIEMMVVIGIIVVLMSLFTGVAISLNSRNDIQQAESIIALLEQANKQWESTSERQVTFGRPGEPTGAVYDIVETIYLPNGPNDPPLQGVFLKIIAQDPAAAKILRQIPDKYLKLDSAKNLRIVDPWDREIKILFPGRLWVRPDGLGVPRDTDGTIRIADENTLGICVNRRICFISPGPDGKLGAGTIASMGGIPQASPEMQDNIYSYQPVLGP